LEVIVIFDPALHSELGQDRHHLPHGDSGQLGSLAKRCSALLVPFHCEQNSAAGDHIPHGFGKITPLFLGEFVQKFEILTIHSDAHRFRHVVTSSFRLASSRIDFL
jgi:hypothetical protein